MNLAESEQYRCRTPLNLYDSPQLDRLATQATIGRYLQLNAVEPDQQLAALPVCLCEDDYPGWLAAKDLECLEQTTQPYQPIALTEAEIRARLPQTIAFAEAAMTQPNEYLWGGTVGPNYDCSGLMQTAFASAGIWLPRDAYQQAAFTQPIPLTDLQPGDLIFFGASAKITHVGLYLGNDRYLHSSGKDQGRNGIGLDRVSGAGDLVSQTYHAQLRGAGRVTLSYQPGQRPWLTCQT